MSNKRQRTALDDFGRELGLLNRSKTMEANYKQSLQNIKERRKKEEAKKANEKQQALKNKWQAKVEDDKKRLGLDYKADVYKNSKQRNEYIMKNIKERQSGTYDASKPFSFYNQGMTEEEKQKSQETTNRLKEYKKTDTYKRYEQETQKAMLTQYLADEERVNNEKTSTWDKINILRPFIARLEDAVSPGNYKLDNGEYVDLPSYNELKSNKVMSEMGTIGQSIHSAAGSLGGMAPAVVASAIPYVGKILGPATTFFTTQNSAKNQKLLEGYTPEQAETYSVVNATLETGLQTLLGGATKIMGGKTSMLSSNISKCTGKFISNPGINRLLSNLGAEEIEEELQMILDPINEHVTLGEYDNLGEALSTLSLDEAGITALSTLLTIGLTEGNSAYKTNVLHKNIEAINKQYGTNFKVTTEGKVTNSKTNKEVSDVEINESIKKIKIAEIQDQQLQNIEQRQQQVEYDYQNGNITEEQYNDEYDSIKNELRIFKEENEKGIVNPITEIEALKNMYQEQYEHNTITEKKYNEEINKLQTKLKEISGKQEDRYTFNPSENKSISILEESAA